MGIWWDKIVEFSVGTIGQSAVDAWRQNAAVDTDISILRSAPLKAHLLIERSECWRLPKYNPIDKLLPELKDAVYEAESLVDEFAYQALKNEVEKNSTGTTFLRNWMGNFPAAVERAFHRLDKISNEMKETCDIRGIPENPNKFSETARPITTTSLDTTKTTKVYGREKELDELFSRMGVPRSGSVAPNSDTYPELESIGKEICSRLKGSPLAAKTIGGLLGTNIDATHWMDIKNSKVWELEQEEHDILPVLQLSYQYLPSDLKKCFSYCALYPKDFKFTTWELTKLWIMHGFINLKQKLEVHWKEPFLNEANGYFNELIQRCFFQKAAGSRSDEYVIHDLMHDMCQSITKDECFCIENEDLKNGIIHPNYKYIRHLSVFQKGIKLQEQKKLCQYEKLFSVRVGPQSSCCITAIDIWCKTLTNIRSLSLSRCKIDKLPESIGNLKHLQYLDISFTKIEKLPESFCNLYNLVYLNMEGCSGIITLPKGFDKLVNLRFVYWPAEWLIFIGQAENLAKEIEKEDMCVRQDIEYLKYMNKIRGSLTLELLGKVPNKEAAEEARLKDKALVRKLDLSWKGFFSDQLTLEDEPHHEAVFQGLCPHPNLEVLKINGYGGRTLPSWFKKEFLPKLTKIQIIACERLTNLKDYLDPKQFPMLNHIDISHASNLESLPVISEFESLKELKISNCQKLTCSKDMVLPPSIKFLELGSSDYIKKSIPSCLQNLTSLKSLKLKEFPDLTIPAEAMNKLKSLRWLSVYDCAGLQSLGGLKFLASLEHLYIGYCPDFVSISAEEASNLKSLKNLSVHGCAKLQSLGGLEFLASLEDIHITCCDNIAETHGRDISRRLPSDLLAELPSESGSRGPKTLLEKRSVKRARKRNRN